MARLLVVDDEPLLRRTLRCILEKAGHEVTEAEDGDAALKQFRAMTPDLVLMDIVMPNREGVETVFELRKSDPLVPIVAMSGGGSIGTTLFLELATRVGATRTISKPIRRDDLLGVVNSALDERARLESA